MKATKILIPILLITLALLALTACTPPQDVPASDASLSVEDAWARQSPMDAGNGAAYMIIKGGSTADALVGVSADVSEVIELHETTMTDDVMRMRPIEGQRIEVPANGTVELKPGGMHVMLINLKQALQPGDTFDLVLQFEQAGARTVPVEVRAVEGMNMGDDSGEMNHAN